MTAERWILHVDLDQFLAAVEVLRHPELRGRPVVVGGAGDPTQRRVVVSTASYEARAFGVHSGMPLRLAARRCPEAVFLPLDQPAYEAASERVMEVLRGMPVVVEVFGWDEAFLASDAPDPERLAIDVRAAVLAETGLHCSVGIGRNKLQAKLATGFAKPDGVYRLTDETWMAVMGDRPTSAIWGIGARTAERLEALGIRTVAQLAVADLRQLATAFGPTIGPSLRAMGMGLGPSDVTAVPREPRSRSRETTFARDLVDRSDIEAQVAGLARELATDAASAGRRVVRVAVKVRVVPYLTRVSAHTLPGPTLDADAIVRGALAVLERFDLGRPVRLLGVRVDYAQPEPEDEAGPDDQSRPQDQRHACPGFVVAQSPATVAGPAGRYRMTRFVVDATAVLYLASEQIPVSREHRLLAPTLLRSQVLSSLHEAVQRGEIPSGEARDRLARIGRLPIRLLGDAVLRRRAWEVADRLGWASTYEAEYVALVQLQADALVTMDEDLARRLEGIVPIASVEALR